MNCLRSLERWDRGFEFHSRHGCLCVCLFCVCVVLCVGSGLGTGWSPVQGVLPTVYGLRNRESGQGPTRGCRAIDREIDRQIDFQCLKMFPTLRRIATNLPLTARNWVRRSNIIKYVHQSPVSQLTPERPYSRTSDNPSSSLSTD
jgi:hypothetical protein